MSATESLVEPTPTLSSIWNVPSRSFSYILPFLGFPPKTRIEVHCSGTEVTEDESLGENIWAAVCKPSRRIQLGNQLVMHSTQAYSSIDGIVRAEYTRVIGMGQVERIVARNRDLVEVDVRSSTAVQFQVILRRGWMQQTWQDFVWEWWQHRMGTFQDTVFLAALEEMQADGDAEGFGWCTHIRAFYQRRREGLLPWGSGYSFLDMA